MRKARWRRLSGFGFVAEGIGDDLRGRGKGVSQTLAGSVRDGKIVAR